MLEVFSNEKVYIAVVIDDLGYGGEGTDEILNLDMPLTVAVLPFSDTTLKDGLDAVAKGKEVIIHMPMEANSANNSWLGENAIYSGMEKSEISEIFEKAKKALPMAVGMNNHMGSKISENKPVLEHLMKELNDNDMYFLDSLTSAQSLITLIGGNNGVNVLKRDVFLDSTDDINVVYKNLNNAYDIAKKEGYAIAIGHVGPEGGKITAEALDNVFLEFERKGVSFITLSELINL